MSERAPNPAQQAAINFRTGPLRIIAGAGTGKSSTLVASAIDLVTSGAAAPHQILALTFTDAASEELASRMRTGLRTAKVPGEITVDTYNAFGGSIVTEHGRGMDLPGEPRLLTPGEAFVLVWRSVDEIRFAAMDLTGLRPRGYGGSGEIGNVLSLHSRLADEDRSLADYAEWVKALPEIAEKDDKDERGIGFDRVRMLECYLRRKKEIGAIDFADQIKFAAELLERDDVRRFYAERYHYLMVDEFQDTNYIQRLMVRRLGAALDGNVRVVGDPYQAIYGFRGAAPDNLERFADEDFPGTTTIKLGVNYRSTPEILDAANMIWAGSEASLGTELAAPAGTPSGAKPLIVQAATIADEVAWIATELRRLHDEETVAWSDMVILVRKNLPKRKFLRALLAHDLPIQAVGGSSLFEQPIIRLVISMLRILADDTDDPALAHLLGSDRWGIDDEPLHLIAQQRLQGESLFAAASRFGRDADSIHTSSVRECVAVIRDLARASRLMPLVELVHAIRSALFISVDRVEEGYLSQFANLVTEFGRGDLDEPTLAELIAYIELKSGTGDDAIQVTKAELGLADTVKIMTIHAAKGLEWPVVLIASANSADFAIGSRPSSLPPELEHDAKSPLLLEDFKNKTQHGNAVAAQKRAHAELETRRTAYVAVTRAMHRLYITWSVATPPRKKDVTLHPQFAAIADYCDTFTAPPAPELSTTISTGAFARTHLDRLNQLAADLALGTSPDSRTLTVFTSAWQESGGDADAVTIALTQVPPRIAQLQNQLVEIERIERHLTCPLDVSPPAGRLTLSHSSLKTFRTCQHRYYLKYIVGLPGYPDRPAATYGTDVHTAVHADAIARMNGTPSDLAAVWPVPGGARQPDLPYIPGLRETYANSIDAQSTVLLSEEHFTLRLPTVNLNGIIDRVQELPDGTVEVTDFKTDRSVRSMDDVRDDWQLAIYLLAMRERQPAFVPQPTQATMVFLRHNQRVTILRDDAELDAVADQIETTATAIRAIIPTAHQSSEAHCRWCDFNRICQFSAVTPTD